MAPPTIPYLSLFAGIGGLDEGVQLAIPTARCCGMVEIEAFAAAVLGARMEDGSLDTAPIWTDIKTFPSSLYRGRVQMVIGGFPCPAVSVAGRGLGLADPRWLWPDTLRVATEVGAEYLFLENVPGLLSAGNGTVYETVLASLAAGGWDAAWLSLRASAVGAPQRRERWFCLARRVDDATGTRQPGREPGAGESLWNNARRGESGGRRDAVADAGSLPLFPPGPADRDGWERLLAARPDLAPAVGVPTRRKQPDKPTGDSLSEGRGFREHAFVGATSHGEGVDERDSNALESGVREPADGPTAGLGLALRTDRLRALGNSCLPLQAGLALRHLMRAMGGDW